MNRMLVRMLHDLGLSRGAARALWALPAVDIAWASDAIDATRQTQILAAANAWVTGQDGVLLVRGWLAQRPSASYRRRAMAALALWSLTDRLHPDVLHLATASGRGPAAASALQDWRQVLNGVLPERSPRSHPDRRHDVPPITVVFDSEASEETHGAVLTPLGFGEAVRLRPQGRVLRGGPLDDDGTRCRVWCEAGRWYVRSLNGSSLLGGEGFVVRRLLGGEVLRLGPDVAYAVQLHRQVPTRQVA